MAGDPARERELAEQPAHAVFVLGDIGIELAVAALEPGARHDARSAVPRSGDEEDVLVPLADDPVQVRIHEIQARRGAEVAEQAGLDVLALERFAQQRVFHQVDLPDGQIVGGPPPAVYPAEQVVRQRALG